MAAGLGFKTFTTGEVLTAADTNGYLMQGVNVFASAAARTSAITSPQEGQMSFLKDTNSTEYYDGAAWAAVGSSGGMALLSTTSLTGATTTISSISQSYNSLFMIIYGVTNATADGTFSIAANGVTNNTNWAGVNKVDQGGQTGLAIRPTGNYNALRTSANNVYSVQIDNYTSATNYKSWMSYATIFDTVSTQYGSINGGGIATNTAISSLVFSNSGGNLSTGTVLLYGVK
jgi:hypothetical protein